MNEQDVLIQKKINYIEVFCEQLQYCWEHNLDLSFAELTGIVCGMNNNRNNVQCLKIIQELNEGI